MSMNFDCGSPCFFSVATQMLGCNWKRARPANQPIEVLFAKNKLPKAIVCPPTTGNSPYSEHVKVFSHSNNPVNVSTSPVTDYKAMFSNSGCVFRAQEWFNDAKDDALRYAHDSALSVLTSWASRRLWARSTFCYAVYIMNMIEVYKMPSCLYKWATTVATCKPTLRTVYK
jgi:hypothetical protein